MNPELKEAFSLLLPSAAFQAVMAAINKQREAAVYELTSQGVIQSPQALAAVAGEIRAYDNIRSLWEQLKSEVAQQD